MSITAIQQQLRTKFRYSIYVDDRYVFSLSADALLETGLYVGQEISTEQLKTYKKLSEDDRAYVLALAYVVRRMRSRWELTNYLRRKGYDAALSRRIMARLERAGVVNDEAFAEAWARNRRLLKPTSKRRLTQELRQKRVPDSIVEQTLIEDDADERVILHELIARRRKQTKYQDDLKLMQYLARQGFAYDDIKAAIADDI